MRLMRVRFELRLVVGSCYDLVHGSKQSQGHEIGPWFGIVWSGLWIDIGLGQQENVDKDEAEQPRQPLQKVS